MLTAKVCVTFEGDWTQQLGEFDLAAEVLASRFSDREYMGLVAVETEAVDDIVDVIAAHVSIESLEVVDASGPDDRDREVVTLLVQGELSGSTPLKELLQAGYLPLQSATIEDGRECFDLIVRDRAALSEATSLLEPFGAVSLERVTTGYQREVVPSHAEWQAILESIPPRRRQVLDTAVREGYFESPRGATLEDVADLEGITKSTASAHLRKAQKELFEFILPYVKLKRDDTPA